MKRSAFLEKSLILVASNIITGTLTFIFSIILSREIGSKGMGLYQLVMPVYSMFLCITGGGITVSISKIAAEKKAMGNMRELYRTISSTCVFEIVWSIIVTVFLVISSAFISSEVLNDKRTLYSIFAFSPAIIIVSISSVYKGAYYGLQRVVEPAFIDIIEKIVRITIMVVAVKSIGLWGIEFSAAAAAFSLTCGELSSLALFFLCYRQYVKKNPGFGKSDNSPQLIFNVLKLAIPLALNGILSTIFTTLITVLIPRRLQVSGIVYEEALSMLGKLQGMALTIVFYPMVIVSSINVLLIPSISEAVTFSKGGIINHRINTAFRIAAVTSFAATSIILAIPSQLGTFFYKDAAIGTLLKIIAPGIPLLYIQGATFTILNGLGKQTNILINSTILSVFDLIVLYILLGIPSLGIQGFAIDLIISSILGIIINLFIVKRTFSYRFDFYNSILLPAMCSIISFIVTKIALIHLSSTPMIILLSFTIFSVLYFPLYNFSKQKIT